MPNPIRLALLILTCYRLARLLAYEEGPGGILEALREELGGGRLAADGQPDTNLGRLVTCPYCLGVWLALLLPLLPSWALVPLAVAGGQAYLEGTSE